MPRPKVEEKKTAIVMYELPSKIKRIGKDNDLKKATKAVVKKLQPIFNDLYERAE